MKKLIALAALVVAAFAAPLAVAQPDNTEAIAELKALRTAAQKDKRALVASTVVRVNGIPRSISATAASQVTVNSRTMNPASTAQRSSTIRSANARRMRAEVRKR